MWNKSTLVFWHRWRGFAHIEVLVAVVLLGVLLAPAMDALSNAIRGSSAPLAKRQLDLRNKMEEVLRQPFNSLYTHVSQAGNNTSINEKYSDPPEALDRRVVVMYRCKAETGNWTPTDTGLLLISVYYQADGSATALTTLAGKWW
jgi:type II secretory pathway component PulJ